MERIILDLELRDDIDDCLLLLYCLINKIDIYAIILTSPTRLEVQLANSVIARYSVNTRLIINNSRELLVNNDVNNCLMFMMSDVEDLSIDIDSNNAFDSEHQYIYMCGGALTSLQHLMNKINISKAYIQGGFAGSDVCGIENTLYKFRKRKYVPSWNFNLDSEATKNVLTNTNFPIFLISKNVTHGVIIYDYDMYDFKNCSDIFTALNSLFNISIRQQKALHDLLLIMSHLDDSLVEYTQVNIKDRVSDSGKIAWSSEMSNNSNVFISIKADKAKIIKNVINY